MGGVEVKRARAAKEDGDTTAVLGDPLGVSVVVSRMHGQSALSLSLFSCKIASVVLLPSDGLETKTERRKKEAEKGW